MDSLFCYFIKMPSKVLALLKKKSGRRRRGVISYARNDIFILLIIYPSVARKIFGFAERCFAPA
jgi:hypothetical protein